MTLVLRKLLASSTFSFFCALTTISNRLRFSLQRQPKELLDDEIDKDYEAYGETAEEWGDDETIPNLTESDRAAIEEEIAELDSFTKLATSISHNAKGKALIKALGIAFNKTKELDATQKAIIFTESRRTQDYLLRLLADSQFSEGIVLFNGTNTDDRSKQIYNEWLERYVGTDRMTGSRTADMRSALVDYFREQGRIMIATEAGAEGINLQFCSLIVNYDLPWNPQRIEQRIGRCHRYGQKHDVVVVNFLNRKNAADQRVYELLDQKFKLFEGVFGASDEVLGAIESGVDFEKRIADIYQRCRKEDDIQTAFDQLQLELSTEINESMIRTRQQLLENFDDEVREKLRIQDEASKEHLNKYEKLLMRITQHELNDYAEFINDSSFTLKKNPFIGNKNIPQGLYELPRRSGEAHFYRLNHPLAEEILNKAKDRNLPISEIGFNYQQYEGKISVLEPFIGKSGWLSLKLFSVESFDQEEDYLIASAITDDGMKLDTDIASRILLLPGNVIKSIENLPSPEILNEPFMKQQKLVQNNISERNARFYEAEADKLDSWSDDLKVALEREIKELDRQIKEARKQATFSLTLEEKLTAQKQIKSIEAQRNQKRKKLFDAQDQIDKQRDDLISQIENKLNQKIIVKDLFHIRWHLN